MPRALKMAALGEMGETPFERSVHVASWLALGAAIAVVEVLYRTSPAVAE